MDDTKSCYQLIIKITISEKKKNNQVTKKAGNLHSNIDKGGVNFLRLLAKTQKQAYARTRDYNFECDWFKNVLFSTISLAKLLSDSLLLDSLLLDSLLSDSLISQSHSKM